MVVQHNAYLKLLDDAAGIDPAKGMAEELSKLSQDPIDKDDTLKLLLLAEFAMQARQWQAAAQLFARVMVNPFRLHYSEPYLVEHASRVILLTTQRHGDLNWATDLLLYSHRRMTAALRADGMQQMHIHEWMVTAVGELLRESTDRKTAMKLAMVELHPGNDRISKRYQSEIGPARQLLARALLVSPVDPATAQKKHRVRNLVFLAVAVAAIVFIDWHYALGSWFTFPRVSKYFDDSWSGSLLRATLVAWPFLLAATWAFALFESIRTRALYFVSPYYLIRHRIAAGEIMPFMRDWFFHIFQFVWVAPLVIAWLLFTEYQHLPDWLPSAWNPPPDTPLLFEHWLDSIQSGSDFYMLAIAAGPGLYSLYRQWKIENDRIAKRTDVYWWDRRISTAEWVTRLIMVGLDMFLATFLALKILFMLFVVYKLANADALKISYFSPDGVGGLKHLTNMLMYLSWLVFVFGLFVFASLYLHWNLREYRTQDFSLVGMYILFVILAVVPLGTIEYKLSREHDVQFEQVKSAKVPGSDLEDTADYVKNVDAVRDWNVSALKVGILGNPVLPLGFQFIVVLFQALGRAGKIPKLPIPGLGEQDDSKGGHDAA